MLGPMSARHRAVTIKENSIYGPRVVGYVVEARASVSIDTLEDWELAESVLRNSDG